MRKKYFGFNDLVVYEKDFLVASNKWNGLYRISLNKKNIEFLCEFPGEEKNQENLYMRTVLYQGKIVFAPSSAKQVAIYDISKNKFKMLTIKRNEIKDKFYDIIIYKECVFLIGHRYPAILKINMVDYSIHYINNWVDDLKNTSEKNFPGFVFAEKLIDNKLWIPQFISNLIMIFDLETNSYQIIKIKNAEGNISGIVKGDENVYLCINGTIYKLDSNNICHKIGEKREWEGILCHLIYTKDKMFLFPIGRISHGSAVSVSLDTYQSKKLFVEKTNGKYCSFSCVRRYENKIYLFLNQLHMFIIFDILNNKYTEWKIDFSINTMNSTYTKEVKIEFEEYYDDLSGIFDEVIQRKDDEAVFQKETNFGYGLWEICK